MKILHLNYSDQIGGAATSVMRLHKSLIKKKIQSYIFVKEKNSNEKNIIIKKSTISLIVDLLKKAILRNIKRILLPNLKSTFSMNLLEGIKSNEISLHKPDVLNLHWISNEMISLKEISKIQTPIVWTLVDMWLFCGGEHYVQNKRYLNGYSESNKQSGEKIDINRYIWKHKKKFLSKKIKIVCISKWLAKEAKKSKLLKEFDIRVINCTIDTDLWKPINKKIAKKILGLDPKRKVLLFGATGGTKDPRKGFKYLEEAIKSKELKNKVFDILIFGEEDNFKLKFNNQNIFFKSGKFYGNDIALRTMYSAADLIVAPSTQEAFGQVASEAGACETPCVSFENTGFEDVIIHKKTGYLAKFKKSKDLAYGISWCLNNNNKYKLGKQARKNIVSKFSNKVISSKYIKLYKEVTKK